MTFNDAAQAFEQNLKIINVPSTDLMAYNLNLGLQNMCEALQNMASRIHMLEQQLARIERNIDSK